MAAARVGRGLPRLRGQVLGLVGFGNIARALVPKARAFGLEVLAYTPRPQPGTLDGVETTNDLGASCSNAPTTCPCTPRRTPPPGG